MNTIALDTARFRLPDGSAEQDLHAKYFRALGDPTRLHMLERLSGGERSVGERVAALSENADHVAACTRIAPRQRAQPAVGTGQR